MLGKLILVGDFVRLYFLHNLLQRPQVSFHSNGPADALEFRALLPSTRGRPPRPATVTHHVFNSCRTLDCPLEEMKPKLSHTRRVCPSVNLIRAYVLSPSSPIVFKRMFALCSLPSLFRR